MLICLDTSLLIIAQQESPSAGREALYAAASEYEKWLQETDCGVLIPTPVISEFLSSRDATVRHRVLSGLQEFADIGDFDLRAAELAGRLRYAYYEEHGLPAGLDRQVLTVDMMIAAIAIVSRASHIITHDTDDFETIVSLVEGFSMNVRGVADGPPGQAKLV